MIFRFLTEGILTKKQNTTVQCMTCHVDYAPLWLTDNKEQLNITSINYRPIFPQMPGKPINGCGGLLSH